MNYKEIYENWKNSSVLTAEQKAEIENISDEEVLERFCAPLEFGTAGLRGVVAVGLNRMNVFTLCQAVRALARSLPEGARVAICRDARLSSCELASAAACAMAEEGVHVLYFKEARPTPQLSFAVRHFKTEAGINLTASHNPKEYNGCKFYGDTGAQLAEEPTAKVSAIMDTIDVLSPLPQKSFDEYLSEGKIEYLECDEEYIAAVLASRKDADMLPSSDLKVVYTPFHGVGGAVMPEVLKRAGLKNVYYQQEQMMPDGHFTTLKNPNPEYTEGFALAEKLAKEVGADIIVATDPDADRVAVSVLGPDGSYTPLTGNKTGALLTDYLLRGYNGKLKPTIIKTIVSTPLAESICENYGADCFSVFTGFKNIAEKLEETKDTNLCLMGFEESIGYMVGNHVRDKDGISGTLAICEMAAWYKKNGKTLLDGLSEFTDKYGDFRDVTLNVYRYGTAGAAEIKQMMVDLRACPPIELCGKKVEKVCDYLTGENAHIKGSNVLEYRIEGGSRILVRPSGTEPKIKIYSMTRNMDAKQLGDELIARMTKA